MPFVDILTTERDVTLPLTVEEWDEWGASPLPYPSNARMSPALQRPQCPQRASRTSVGINACAVLFGDMWPT